MANATDTCPRCGHDETVEVRAAYAEGTLCEADYLCKRCRRHRARFAYGEWSTSTGELPGTEASAPFAPTPLADVPGAAHTVQNVRALLARARNLLSHPSVWAAAPSHLRQRQALSDEIAQHLSATRERPTPPQPQSGPAGEATLR